MPKLVTWVRAKDEQWFAPFFPSDRGLQVQNAARAPVALEEMDALLLTGGADIAAQYLHQPVPDLSVLEEPDLARDQWEFAAVNVALERGHPILAICKGMQLLNVALGGTLRLDIPGHNLPEQKTRDIQPLRYQAKSRHRFAKVNSAHHQAIERLGDGLIVEAWSEEDDIVEQVRLKGREFVLGVQYHPERGTIYGQLFEDFLSRFLTTSE